MSIEAATTPDESGRDSVQTSTDINDPANLNFEDESDETQTTVPEQAAEVEGEPDEGADDDAQQSEESENDETETEYETDEEGSDENQPIEVNVPDDALVTLSDGRKVKLGDLKRSPFFEADYTRGKQELSNRFKSLSEQAAQLENVTTVLANFLSEQIPPEPDAALAWTDPNAHYQQKLLREAAIARVASIFEMGAVPKKVAEALTAEQIDLAQKEAEKRLIEYMPRLANPAERRKFNEMSWAGARRLGYDPKFLAEMADEKIMVAAYYTEKGFRAEEAEKRVQAKVSAAPRVTPAKTAQTKGNPQFLKNKEAMRRLAKTGSFNDAMNIDFD